MASKLRLLTALTVLFMVCAACTGTPPDRAAEDREVELDPAELLDNGDLRVYPVLTVEVATLDQTRELFHRGEAHFESSTPFQQISWMMDAEEPSGIEYSVLKEDGSWSQWSPVEITFSEEIFHNALVALGEPAHEIRLRGGETIHSARFEFFEELQARPEILENPGLTPILETPSQEEEDLRTSIQAVAPSSLVVSRSQWGAALPNKICGNVVAPYRMAIHHTAVPSGDMGNPAVRMRQMQSYHMNNLGWCDIGYHFVVSQSGQIFQGRSRSNRPAAHVVNQNAGNVGISFIANFNSQTPTNTQLNTGADIIRWVHQTHGVQLNRTRIRGHREHAGQNTSCPGNNMIPMIDVLIQRASSTQSQPTPSEPAPPPPEPGGCVPAADSNASNAFFKDFRVTATGYDDAVRLYNAGITQGCSASPRMFCPKCPLTRRQMATFLARAANLNVSNPPAQATFSDVPVGSAGFAYVEAIAAAGITTGCGNGRFCPNDEITRAQAATMIHRAMDWPDEVPASAPSFSDVGVDNGHFAAIETMKQRCVTNGCGNDKFCPGDSLSRGQAAAMIARAFNLEGSNPCAAPGGCQASAAFGTENSLFKDFPTTAQGYDEAVLLFDAGITTGCTSSPELMFCPNCSINRRQMIMFIVRAAGLNTNTPPATPSFNDVGTDETGYAEIEAAYAAGITTGCGNGNFCPNREISRAEVATLIANARGWEPIDPTSSSFSDVAVNSTHHAGIESLADRCVTQGCRLGEFCPTGGVSRAHAALFIARAFDLDGINPCVDNPGGGFGAPDSGLTEPEFDLSGEEQEGVPPEVPGASCEDVDPDFVDASCSDEQSGNDSNDDTPDGPGDGATDDNGDSSGDDADGDDSSENGDTGTSTQVQGGCTTTPGAPTTMIFFVLGLLVYGLRRPGQS